MVGDDARVDELELQVSNLTLRLLALRQPMAVDLREIVAALKISSDLERIGDYAANVAKRAIALSQQPPCAAGARHCRGWRGWCSRSSRTCSTPMSIAMPTRRWPSGSATRKLDEMYTSLFRELLTYMMEDPRNIGA